MTPNEVKAEIEPLMKCGGLSLYCSANTTSCRKPEMIVGIKGGQDALCAASNDDIIMAMVNASKVGEILKRELPKHWVIKH